MELAIPFKSISFDESADTWGLNVYRNIGRAGERAQWANSPLGQSQLLRLR